MSEASDRMDWNAASLREQLAAEQLAAFRSTPTAEPFTLRDRFAAYALAGWLASFGDDAPHPATGTGGAPMVIAHQCYAMADAMLAARLAASPVEVSA